MGGLDQDFPTDTALALSGCGGQPLPDAESVPAPFLAATAVRLFGALSKTLGYMHGTGTSAAAAMVSGACALAQQAAGPNARRFTEAGLMKALLGQDNALLTGENWRPDIGFGALHFDAEVARIEFDRKALSRASNKEQQFHE